MNIRMRIILAVALLAGNAGTASAATQWTLDNTATSPVVTSWNADSNTSALAQGSVTSSGGTGAAYVGESTTNDLQSLDNNVKLESLLLDFSGQQIRLDKVNIGSSYNDSDFFVLAYTGSQSFSGSLAGAKYQDLLSSGWTLVSQKFDNRTGSVSLGTATDLYASFWLIGAGGFQGGVTSGEKNKSSFWAFGTTGAKYDYLKLAGVEGVQQVAALQAAAVPEPGSLALAGAAFLGMMGMRRRKAAV